MKTACEHPYCFFVIEGILYCIDTILVYIGTNKGFTFLRTYLTYWEHIEAYLPYLGLFFHIEFVSISGQEGPQKPLI